VVLREVFDGLGGCCWFACGVGLDGQFRAASLADHQVAAHDGISPAAYSITVAAFALWVLYGALNLQWPIIVSNFVCLVLSAFILVMTLLPQREKDGVAKALDPER
jgi:hypothetical protein